MERKGTPSVPVPEESRAGGLPYVLTDIMTYFTMLVGIYFPSVTGEALPCPSTVQAALLPQETSRRVAAPRLLIGVREAALSQAPRQTGTTRSQRPWHLGMDPSGVLTRPSADLPG